MLNHQNYIEMIDSAIDKNFNKLDSMVEACDKLKEARNTYYQALNELHLGIDNVENNPKKYEEALAEAQEEMALVHQDIGSYECDGYYTIEPLTVGLFGEWGSGKTHLLKGVKNRIIQSQESARKLWEKTPNPDASKVNKLVIPIFFNAWRFEKEEHIIIPLFQTLLSELENYDYIPKLKQIKTKIKILSFALIKNLQKPEGLDIGKVFAGDLSSLKSVRGFFNWKGVSDELKKEDKSYLLEQLLTSERIESVYLKIPEWIEKITIFDDVRFVFLVDDLDRCLPENTLKMLESMKLFLDVAGCSFVLAIDDDVVERGVEHHYRDYLHRNDNHIYMTLPCLKEQSEPKKEESTQESNALPQQNYHKTERRELPITGSEYLEKMVQLPFRIPPIDTSDVKRFLQDKYERFRVKEPTKEEVSQEKRAYSESQNSNERVLEFFAKTIPPKPRKIIRTINLYESKEELMQGLSIDALLLAKLTLLELFVPKLFRFMQAKGYVRIFNRLVEWQKKYSRLSETSKIAQSIHDNTEFPQIDKETFLYLVEIIEALYKSRVEFNLDAIFSDEVEPKVLKRHFTFKQEPAAKPKGSFIKRSPIDTELFLNRLLSSDELLWVDAFEQDSQLSQQGVVLDENTFQELLNELDKKSQKRLVQNPIWLKNISTHLSDNDFRELLTKHNPFKESEDEQ